MLSMEGRPKRQSAVDKDYRERKRIRKEKEHHRLKEKDNESELPPDVVQAYCRQLYRLIKDYPDPDEPEYLISTLFLQLPSKRQYPDYYEVIKNPIAFSHIKSKIDQEQYKTVSELKNDIELMVSNAKKYNIKESQVYQDAVKIHKLVKHWRPDGDSNASTPNISRKGSLKDKTSSSSSASASSSPSTNGIKGKTVLKLPGGAFGVRQQQPQQQQQTSPPQQQHVKAIRLKAVDKQSKKRTVPLPELMEAIYNADQKKTLELLETDPTIDVNEMVEMEMYGDKFTWGPLHAACYYGDVKVCQALINMGANIELNDTWYSATPLGWAAFGDKDKVARFLVEKHNANRKAKNIHNQVPFDVVNNKDDPCWVGIFKGPYAHEKGSPENKLVEQSQRSKESQSPVTIIATTESPQLIPGKKRRGRPPKSEKEEVRAVEEIDLHDFNPVEFMKDIFHSVRVHTDNSGRLYSEIFEDLPDRKEYPDYYNVITDPRSFTILENNMVHRRYPTLGAWWNDLKLIFENAMEYNEPGSRVFRDAKLLLRLMNRLRDKTFARFGIPEKQEPAVMRLIVSNVPYEADDRRRPPKRATSKPRSQTDERSTVTPTPEMQHHHHHHHPSITMVAQQPPLPPTQILPPQQPPHHSIPHPAAMAAAVAGGTSVMAQSTPPNMMNGPGGPRSIMTRPFMNGPPPPGVINMLGAISTNSIHPAFPTPDFVTMPPPPPPHEMIMNGNEPPMMMNGQRPVHMGEEHNTPTNPAFFDLFNVDMHDLRPLKAIRLETPDKTFTTSLDGHVVGHSLTVPSKVDVMVIKPVLEQVILPEQRRISIAVLQNNGRLNMSNMNPTSMEDLPSWQSAPLLRGLNTIKITVTANLTRAPNMMPDYRTQIYFLFITQTW